MEDTEKVWSDDPENQEFCMNVQFNERLDSSKAQIKRVIDEMKYIYIE